jgi:dynein heavy chain
MRIQEMMVKSLYDLTKQALKDYPDDHPLDRKKWFFSFPAQSILLVDQIKWTDGVTKAILSLSRGNPNGINIYYDFMK